MHVPWTPILVVLPYQMTNLKEIPYVMAMHMHGKGDVTIFLKS
jgi:hypothetical protein